MRPIGTNHTVLSRDGTRIGYLSVGRGPSVLVLPGVLSMAADYAAFARALSEHFTVHTIERRGRGESGPQGDDYSIVKECEDVLALQAETDAALVVGHSYGGLIALEAARNNTAFSRIAVYEPGVSLTGRCQRRGCLGMRRSSPRRGRRSAPGWFVRREVRRGIRRRRFAFDNRPFLVARLARWSPRVDWAARAWGVHAHWRTNCDMKSVDLACNRLHNRIRTARMCPREERK